MCNRLLQKLFGHSVKFAQYKTYTRTNLWQQICDKLKIPFFLFQKNWVKINWRDLAPTGNMTDAG
jgi:hypothetical protein